MSISKAYSSGKIFGQLGKTRFTVSHLCDLNHRRVVYNGRMKKKPSSQKSKGPRIFVPWNTGTQVHKKKHEKRQPSKKKRYLKEE